MKIAVEFLSMPVVTKIVGSKSISLNFSGQTIEDLMNELVTRYGEKVRGFLLDESGKLDRIFKILLNKKEWISRDQMSKILKDGDKVTIMMLVGGG
jgi:molybdopterin converting factor small subunit